MVCAFPKDSRMGLACKIWRSRWPSFFPMDESKFWAAAESWSKEADVGRGSAAMAARNWMTFFVFSVFPAPDSPL